MNNEILVYKFIWETCDSEIHYYLDHNTVFIDTIYGEWTDTLDEGTIETIRKELCMKHYGFVRE
jgi:hypothetical protein